jgi:hypothetical protein
MPRQYTKSEKLPSTYGQRIVDKIFELDVMYQNGKIKAKNREDFINTHLYSMVDKALELAYNQGMRTRPHGW